MSLAKSTGSSATDVTERAQHASKKLIERMDFITDYFNLFETAVSFIRSNQARISRITLPSSDGPMSLCLRP